MINYTVSTPLKPAPTHDRPIGKYTTRLRSTSLPRPARLVFEFPANQRRPSGWTSQLDILIFQSGRPRCGHTRSDSERLHSESIPKFDAVDGAIGLPRRIIQVVSHVIIILQFNINTINTAVIFMFLLYILMYKVLYILSEIF